MEEKDKSQKAAGAFAGRRVFCLLCSICLLFQPAAAAVPAQAAIQQADNVKGKVQDTDQAEEASGEQKEEEPAGVTFSQLNDERVFLKQSKARVCTLTASAMLLRRAAMLMGRTDWQKITEQSVRKNAWVEGTGLKWNFTSAGITVAQKTLSSKTELIKLLAKHPEGIVIYNTRLPHAILVTDYTDGVLYCSDPSNDRPSGRYPITRASITAESAGRCWYVKAPAGLSVVQDVEDCEADGLTYEIIDSEEQTAACTGQSENRTSVTIPDTIAHDGAEYKVVQIAKSAFEDAAKLKEITIGANVASIGAKAFFQCKKLKTLNIHASNLKEIGADAFAKIYKKAKFFITADDQTETYDQIKTFANLLTGTSVPGTVQVEVSRETILGTKAGKGQL